MDFFQAAGLQRLIVPGATNPAAGQDWALVLPSVPFGQFGWLIKSVQASLVQGAAQTPQPVLVLDDGVGHTIGESAGAINPQSANTTCLYSWTTNFVQSGIQGAGADQHAQSPLPMGSDCLLLPGWRVLVHTLGIGANSQWQNIVVFGAANG